MFYIIYYILKKIVEKCAEYFYFFYFLFLLISDFHWSFFNPQYLYVMDHPIIFFSDVHYPIIMDLLVNQQQYQYNNKPSKDLDEFTPPGFLESINHIAYGVEPPFEPQKGIVTVDGINNYMGKKFEDYVGNADNIKCNNLKKIQTSIDDLLQKFKMVFMSDLNGKDKLHIYDPRVLIVNHSTIIKLSDKNFVSVIEYLKYPHLCRVSAHTWIGVTDENTGKVIVMQWGQLVSAVDTSLEMFVARGYAQYPRYDQGVANYFRFAAEYQINKNHYVGAYDKIERDSVNFFNRCVPEIREANAERWLDYRTYKDLLAKKEELLNERLVQEKVDDKNLAEFEKQYERDNY